MPAPPLTVIFMGTAELACASLSKLASDPGIRLLEVVTQPDRPRDRNLKLQPSPVKALACQLNLAVSQPAKARDPEFIAHLQSLQPELIVVAAYGQILPSQILDLPAMGCFNVHTSLLPKHRGAAPVQWAILDGDSETGVTIMQMDPGLDTGDMLRQVKTPIHSNDNAATLHARLAGLGADLLLQTIADARQNQLHPVPQDNALSSYARKITKADGLLDWSQPARHLWNRVRALIPWPGAYTTFQPEPGKPVRTLKIWQARPVDNIAPPSPETTPCGAIVQADKNGLLVICGDRQRLRLEEVQLEGGKRLSVEAFLAGNTLPPGTRLGAPVPNAE